MQNRVSHNSILLPYFLLHSCVEIGVGGQGRDLACSWQIKSQEESKSFHAGVCPPARVPSASEVASFCFPSMKNSGLGDRCYFCQRNKTERMSNCTSMMALASGHLSGKPQDINLFKDLAEQVIFLSTIHAYPPS